LAGSPSAGQALYPHSGAESFHGDPSVPAPGGPAPDGAGFRRISQSGVHPERSSVPPLAKTPPMIITPISAHRMAPTTCRCVRPTDAAGVAGGTLTTGPAGGVVLARADAR